MNVELPLDAYGEAIPLRVGRIQLATGVLRLFLHEDGIHAVAYEGDSVHILPPERWTGFEPFNDEPKDEPTPPSERPYRTIREPAVPSDLDEQKLQDVLNNLE